MSEPRRADRTILDEIRNRIDIAELIGETVSLKKAGASYKGLCPFHTEKSPSFNVNSDRGLYKCFGCGKSGDIFSFIQETQGLSFPEAMRELARRAGVTIPEYNREGSSVREEILELNEAARKLFAETLAAKEGAEARAYLGKRGMDAAMIDRFGLGLAPAGWETLFKRVSRKCSAETIKSCGLFRERESGGWYDLFRDRVIFPIADIHGRTVAFGGREYRTDRGPKYINSPETPVYVKGRTLYALNLAKETIKRQSRAVLVEGYTDVILCHKYGFTQVVASLGTALTHDQIAIISRLATKVILAYDPDSAGRKAADRGIDIALSEGLDVRIAVLPDGEDPADLLLANGEQRFSAAIEKAEEFLENRMTHLLESSKTPQERAKAARNMMLSLAGVTEPVLRSAFAKRIGERFGVSEEALKTVHAKEPAADDSRAQANEGAQLKKVLKGLDPELSILKLMIENPELRERAAKELAPEVFSKEVRREVYSAIVEAGRCGESMKGDLGGRVKGIGLDLLAHLATSDLPGENVDRLFTDYAKHISVQRIDAEINDCTVSLQDEGLPVAEKIRITKKLSKLLEAKKITVNTTTSNKGKAGEQQA